MLESNFYDRTLPKNTLLPLNIYKQKMQKLQAWQALQGCHGKYLGHHFLVQGMKKSKNNCKNSEIASWHNFIFILVFLTYLNKSY